MLKIAIVVFRECLEIAVLLSIVLAATRNIKGSIGYVIAGVMLGVTGASLIAFFTSALTHAYGGIGDEIFDAIVISITVLLIGYTVIWMQGYGAYFKATAISVAEKVECGQLGKLPISFIVATTIFRECSEIILFIYSIISASTLDSSEYAIGFILGMLLGVSCGVAIYLGLIKFGGMRLFKICSIMLIFIAAGLAAEVAGIVTSIGVVDIFNAQAWDTSWLITDEGILGKVLKIFIGYEAKPNGMQIISYFATLVLLSTLGKFQEKRLNALKRKQDTK